VPPCQVHPAKANTVPRSEMHNSVSQSSYGRKAGAQAKKGGHGGRNWGKHGDEYDAPAFLDRNDPNYDPAEDDSKKQFVFVASES